MSAIFTNVRASCTALHRAPVGQKDIRVNSLDINVQWDVINCTQ